jgi:hypothetical protein
MATRTQAPDTDATRAEYGTYAPRGETCRKCRQPFTPLEPCRRSAANEKSGSAGVVGQYEHHQCPIEAASRRRKVRK